MKLNNTKEKLNEMYKLTFDIESRDERIKTRTLEFFNTNMKLVKEDILQLQAQLLPKKGGRKTRKNLSFQK